MAGQGTVMLRRAGTGGAAPAALVTVSFNMLCPTPQRSRPHTEQQLERQCGTPPAEGRGVGAGAARLQRNCASWPCSS
eukprot:991835-Rhodomonas_salina.1